MSRTVRHVAVVGTGVIGSSWVSQFLAAGLTVSATDPSPGADERLRQSIADHWPILERLGLEEGASPDRAQFFADPVEALEGADFVQENGPERQEIKGPVIAQIDEVVAPDVVIASSSSGLLPSAIQQHGAHHPERILVGHPFNPPHLIPLVEVVGGELTSPAAIQTAMAFYAALGKRPIHVRKELPGHVTNRLQVALWREAYSLVERGVASVADIDLAVSNGPGLRWALLGPFVTQHLSGGDAGLAHVLEHLGPPMVEWWKTLETPELTPELAAALVAGVDEELTTVDPVAMVTERDALLEQLLRAKAASPNLPGSEPDTTGSD